MTTYIKINDQIAGPFNDAEIHQKLASGIITSQSPAWRLGMTEWTTLGALHPAWSAPAAPKASPPPLPGTSPSCSDDHSSGESSASVNKVLPQPTTQSLDPQPDVLERLESMAEGFLRPLQRRLGLTARPDPLTFFSHRVVTSGIQRLRLDLLKGATLTETGVEFAVAAAACLARIAVHNWQRRGLPVFGRVHFEPGSQHNEILLVTERMREGQHEVYSHDFLADMFELLLRPPRGFPTLHGRLYILSSLTLPSPEQLYLYGACLMNSDSARGSWPKTKRPGGLDEDFQRSKELLVDDLHRDCDLPLDDEALRQLSLWIVFPPYGWDMNDANDYNFMTVFDQISNKQIVPLDVGVDYLRSLLQCQGMDIRNFAARCLMVYRIPPRDLQEAWHYLQAMQFSDYDMAGGSMAKYQAQLEGVEPSDPWREQTERERRGWVDPSVTLPWQNTPLFSDPDYRALEKVPPEQTEEGARLLDLLRQRYPEDWCLQTIHASILMKGPDPERGEAALRQLVRQPFRQCDDAHLRLGTLLKHRGRREEAMQIFEDAVARWPWHHRAVDSCLWLVTDGMTRFPDQNSQAA